MATQLQVQVPPDRVVRQAAGGLRGGRLRRRVGGRDQLPALQAVEALLRARFALEPADIVLVRQERPTQPGFPQVETAATFWRGDQRYRLRLFKPAAEVGAEDLPPRWLLPSLIDDGLGDCC